MAALAYTSLVGGGLSFVATSAYLGKFWWRKGVAPWWTLAIFLKPLRIPGVAAAHASLNRTCSIVELNAALLMCLYQLQSACVALGDARPGGMQARVSCRRAWCVVAPAADLAWETWCAGGAPPRGGAAAWVSRQAAPRLPRSIVAARSSAGPCAACRGHY